ncbi:hypothetical protein D0S48_16445 [Psychrobacillus sp. AK 1817]|nr:hypothetical protein D0S48_16445 [Psychrobacillus sp. AK 1817]
MNNTPDFFIVKLSIFYTIYRLNQLLIIIHLFFQNYKKILQFIWFNKDREVNREGFSNGERIL